MHKAFKSLARIANALGRSLVIPPLPCKKGKSGYCNLCVFDHVMCFSDIVSSFKHPVKESVFFTNEHVPVPIREEDKHNTVFSFESDCRTQQNYHSSFPAHRDHQHEVKCIPCSEKREKCAIRFGMGRKEKVLKLYSVWWCLLEVFFLCYVGVVVLCAFAEDELCVVVFRDIQFSGWDEHSLYSSWFS